MSAKLELQMFRMLRNDLKMPAYLSAKLELQIFRMLRNDLKMPIYMSAKLETTYISHAEEGPQKSNINISEVGTTVHVFS
jgi:hypothetical protein